MAEVLVDTDIFIDHLRGARRLVKGGHTLFYSVLTRCELFAGCKPEETGISRLLGSLEELGIDRGLAEGAGRIRRHHRLHTVDAIVAATALTHGLHLYTRNMRHFEAVSELAFFWGFFLMSESDGVELCRALSGPSRPPICG